jgi:hypothetical protein
MGYSELTIAGLLGHSVSGVTARYAHVPDAALLAAADKIAERLAQTLDGEVEGNPLFTPSKAVRQGARSN